MSNKFLENIDIILESTDNMSLKILLEEDDWTDAFGDDEKKKKKSSEDEDTESDSDSDDLDIEDEGESSEDEEEAESDEEEEEDVYDELNALTDFTNTITDANFAKNVVKQKYKFDVGATITGKHVVESYGRRLKIKDMMLMLEQGEEEVKKTLDQVEKSLENEQDRIANMADKAQHLSSQIKTGEKVNISSQAQSALNDFENFDHLFSKSQLVANSYIDYIVDISSPKDVETNIKDFIDEFNSKLPSNQKLDIQEDPTSYNAQAGAKPTA